MPTQTFNYTLNRESFVEDVARARTCGLLEDAEKLHAAGLALGASLDNTVVLSPDGVLNPEGLRYADECVRHKVLDAIGDLYCAGAPILGHYTSAFGGHRINNMLLQALFDHADNWTYVSYTAPKPKLITPYPQSAAAAFA